MGDLKYKDITEKIIGAAFNVHSFLDNGFQEVIYQRALALEYTHEWKVILIFWKRDRAGYFLKCTKPIGTRRADFVVEGKVLV